MAEILKTYKVNKYFTEPEKFHVIKDIDMSIHTSEFVSIVGPEFEVCGKFGVDSVVDGKCPDGIVYDWNKASRIGRVKKERPK